MIFAGRVPLVGTALGYYLPKRDALLCSDVPVYHSFLVFLSENWESPG